MRAAKGLGRAAKSDPSPYAHLGRVFAYFFWLLVLWFILITLVRKEAWEVLCWWMSECIPAGRDRKSYYPVDCCASEALPDAATRCDGSLDGLWLGWQGWARQTRPDWQGMAGQASEAG